MRQTERGNTILIQLKCVLALTQITGWGAVSVLPVIATSVAAEFGASLPIVFTGTSVMYGARLRTHSKR